MTITLCYFSNYDTYDARQLHFVLRGGFEKILRVLESPHWIFISERSGPLFINCRVFIIVVIILSVCVCVWFFFSAQTAIWCVPAASRTSSPTPGWRTRRRRAPDVDARSAVHCAVATLPSRRQSPSCRHCVSTVHAHCHARCFRDMRQRCARRGLFVAAVGVRM